MKKTVSSTAALVIFLSAVCGVVSCSTTKKYPADQEVALVAAMYAGDWRSLRAMLALGMSADIEWRTDSSKLYGHSDTLLTWVIARAGERQGRRLVVDLLNAGADPNRGWPSPLRYCLMRGDMDMLKMLVERGAQVDEEDRQNAALERMRESGRVYGYFGDSALALVPRISSAKWSVDAVKYLVEHGASVNGVCGGDALINACLTGSYDLVEYLIELGADVNYMNLSGYTPLRMIQKNTQGQEIVGLLRMHGATNMGNPIVNDYRVMDDGKAIEVAPNVPRGEIPLSWDIVKRGGEGRSRLLGTEKIENSHSPDAEEQDQSR